MEATQTTLDDLLSRETQCFTGEIPPAPSSPAEPVPFRIPDATDRLLWRLVRLFKDVVFLASQVAGRCYASTKRWFAKTYKVSEATVRRWLALLIENGWLARDSLHKGRNLTPLVSAQHILSFLPQFKRLLRGILSAKPPAPQYIPERDINSNNASAPTEPANHTEAAVAVAPLVNHPDPEPVPAPTIPPEVPAFGGNPSFSRHTERPAPRPTLSDLAAGPDREAAVAAMREDVSEDGAVRLVQAAGASAVFDALSVLAWRVRKKKRPDNPGGFIIDFARNLAKGLWHLPAWLAEQRAREEREADRRRAREARTRAAGDPGAVKNAPAEPPPGVDQANRSFDLSAVAADVRAAVLDAALADLLAETPPGPVRARLEKKGTEFPGVEIRAKRMLAAGWGGEANG